ncbi:MAG: tyrosine-type recombinase/integrase [Ginsengibacter sp.]
MIIVQLKPLLHKEVECIGIYFEKNAVIQALVQKAAKARWSSSYKCWYVPLSKSNFEKLSEVLKNKVELKIDELKDYLMKKKQVKNFLPEPTNLKVKSLEKELLEKSSSQIQQSKSMYVISHENNVALQDYKQQLLLKGYSQSTIRTYTGEFVQFLNLIKEKPASEFTTVRIKDYLQYCFEKLKLSENTLHSKINSLKFYYEQVLGREKFFWSIPRPKKQKLLPGIFNQDEIAAIINSVDNKKHKTMLMLAYSGGLRVSEIVAIKTYQVDSKRMTIFISQAKGKKDRMVGLSPVLLVMLREYAKEYNPDKKGYLFMGSTPGSAYSTRSLQEVLQAAKKRAGVMKPGSIHSLRHSFATHLIEKGTDVTMIQKLLGHNDLRTTLIYLHTSNKDLIKIVSPLDDLKLT